MSHNNKYGSGGTVPSVPIYSNTKATSQNLIGKPINSNVSEKELRDEKDAIAILSDFKDSTDPTYVGPGTWNVIHRRSFAAKTKEQQLAFIVLMKAICEGFPCMICRGHCVEYIKNNPMEPYMDVTVSINGNNIILGLFIWAWKFHNAVNSRLKKPIMSWDTAYNLYSNTDSMICSKKCHEAEGLSGDPVPSKVPGRGIVIPTKVKNSDVKIEESIPVIPITSVPSRPFRLIKMSLLNK
jgi:hypothetical protein